MNLAAGPEIEHLRGREESPRVAGRFDGKRIRARFEHDDATVRWTATLRDDSNYVRQELSVTSRDRLSIEQVVLFNESVAGARTSGDVKGSPVVTDTLFFATEHPLSENQGGVLNLELGAWTPAEAPSAKHTVLEWNATDAIRAPGTQRIEFDFLDGRHPLEISGVRLLRDGQLIAEDEHHGATGPEDVDNHYELELSSYDARSTYTVRAEVRGDGGTDSSGVVRLESIDSDPAVLCRFAPGVPLETGVELSVSSVVGIAPAGQMRRGFLYYLERERAHPYRPYLHYNSWYDIGFLSPYTESDVLEVIRTFGKELTLERGVTLDGFLLDDGWDAPDTVWKFHEGFPGGLTSAAKAAARYGASLGVWLSPWGGYGDPRERRLAAGRQQGYEMNEKGFALSGPKYFERFLEICLRMVREFDVDHFKLDGLGSTSQRHPDSQFASDFSAAIALIDEIRNADPDIYINLTTGTWASPFWLLHADSTWRGGSDHQTTGAGSKRQQWMTYRDAEVYANYVKRGPLFPLSSLMLHGIIYAEHASVLNADPGDDLRDEIRSFFASGVQLQEMYISPELMSEENWTDLAEAAKWARKNASILQDSHWVGGDPGKGEVYGWAAWNDGKGVLALRNPAGSKREISLDIADAFELPDGAATRYTLVTPYDDQRVKTLHLAGGTPHAFTLAPFELLVFEGSRRQRL